MRIDTKQYFSSISGIYQNTVRLAKLIWPEKKWTIVLYLFLLLFGTAAPLMQSGSQALLINNLVDTAKTGTADSMLGWIIALSILAYILPFFSDEMLDYFSRIFYLELGEKFEMLILNKWGALDVAIHENSKMNDLFTKIRENGISRVVNFADRQYYLIANIFGTLLAAGVLWSFSFKLFLIVFATTLPALWLEARYGQKVWGIWGDNAERRREFRYASGLFYGVNSLLELKLFQNVKYFFKKSKKIYDEFLGHQKREEKSRARSRFISLTVSQGVVVGAILWLLRGVLDGEMQIGTYLFAVSSINNMRRSLSGFLMQVGRQYTDSLFTADVFKFLDIPRTIENPEHGIKLPPGVPDIKFENVTFAYPGTDKYVVDKFNLHIPAGTSLALIGVNGAGKSTIVKLLCRFYDPDEGRILINGHDLREIDLDSWYYRMSSIFQEFGRYHLLTKDAIAVGRTDRPTDIERVKDAALRSEADDFISKWDNGYNQQLGREFKDGVAPSVGQWQRLALARMFYRDADVMILDEPTSSMDAEAEAKIFENLAKIESDKTTILISHRFSTVRDADQICVIDGGRIVELGTHEELLKKRGGTYAKLFKLQAKGYK